ncbi:MULTISPECIES: tRNA (adenosine(37)-N6)-threonylcarbamoyltransferase complex transferase subunit TsaD [Candidatus Ichthyocystis]|uniref:tRNA (adenosine(37)-N6)-threonylcarbamoyltransferase complex transferase subunit TsaD n=1 Tax=Candidatus Ichthyocystis TaxID=2929841 RepID=UPI000A9B1496|nr:MULTISPECIES: tRNA (adenosine(37)-N6)-threonylcarbamoyltransferase complex transferase subunit TsaD [Ichthyocystis]
MNSNQSHIVLGIETSCDETGLALYDTRKGILAEVLSSQIEVHAAYGGVVPEIASRDHASKISPLFGQVLSDANICFGDISLIAYTRGPGLAGALMVGAAFAQGLAWHSNKPLLGINHLEAHLLSPMMSITDLSFPYVGMLISGGHTQIFHVEGLGNYKLLGETKDDAIGEAFDKTAKLLGLGYPGGPAVSKMAKEFSPEVHPITYLPKPMLHSPDLDMSFSGIKTAVKNSIKKIGKPLTQDQKISIAKSFEDACTEVVVEKIRKSCVQTGLTKFVITGGVSANSNIRKKARLLAEKNKWQDFFPDNHLCTDNGSMIAHAAALHLVDGKINKCSVAPQPLVLPRWPLTNLNHD